MLGDPISSLLFRALLSCSVANSSFQRQQLLEEELGLVRVQLLIKGSVNQISVSAGSPGSAMTTS
jgi:hypothetical protein